MLCRLFPYPTSRKGTGVTQAANASFSRTPQNPSHHPARNNRHHLHQPHKEPTPQPRSYWSTCYRTHQSLHAIRSATKIIQMRRDIECNPHKYLSNIPGSVQASASQLLHDPHWNVHSNFYSQHPLGSAEHMTNPFLNQAKKTGILPNL